MREYAQRPEVKVRKKKYAQRSEVKLKKKEYTQRSEVKLKMREYAQKREVKIRKKEYRQTLYKTNKEEELKNNQKWYQLNKERIRQYAQRPEVKAKKQEYDKKWYQLNKQKKQKQRELQFDRVFSSKQNFELSSFNYNNVYDEQVIKDALNNLELDQLNLLDKFIEQLLVGKPTLKQNLLLNSENLSSNLIFDDMYDEQVIKNVLNNLELDQLNLLDKSIEQLLVGKKNSGAKYWMK